MPPRRRLLHCCAVSAPAPRLRRVLYRTLSLSNTKLLQRQRETSLHVWLVDSTRAPVPYVLVKLVLFYLMVSFVYFWLFVVGSLSLGDEKRIVAGTAISIYTIANSPNRSIK